MTKNENQRLCGGTFFTLLLQARKPRKGVRERFKGASDGLSETATLIALIKVVVPDYMEPMQSMKGTFKGNTSDFKSCKISRSTYLPFGDSAEVSAFDIRVKTEYRKALAAMSGFVSDFIDSGASTKKDERLVKALLELIDVDDEIDDTQLFYINENGSTITKAALRDVSDICLQSFLLGIWHFVLVERKDNTLGRATYDLWCPENRGAERKYTGTMGVNITRPINVRLHKMVDGEMEHETTATVEDEPSAEYGEAFVNDADEETSAKTTNQTVNNPFVFNQYGCNSFQIGSIGTITIYNGGGKHEK